MNKDVYSHILATYGRRPAVWLAVAAEGLRGFIGRVITVVLLANMVSSVAIGDFDSAQNMIVIWAILTVVSGLLAAATDMYAIWVENHVYEDLMIEYYTRLTTKDMLFFRNQHAGYLAAMFRQYLDSALLIIRMIRGDLLRTFISLTFPAVVLLFASWQVGLVATALILLQGAYMVWVSRKANVWRQESHEVYREISGEVADDVTNIVAFKASGKEQEARDRIAKLRKRETWAFWMRRRVTISYNMPRMVVTTALVALAFWLALESESGVQQTVNTLVLTITYMFQILRNLDDLPDLIFRHDDLITKMHPTLAIISNKDEDVKDPKNPLSFKPSRGAISIRDLDFSYQDGKVNTTVFKKFNLDIAGGEHVGVVGLSGAGKSTLASLLMRFDDIQSGEILIDGVNIKDVKQRDLRSHIAYVPQEPLLFHRSVHDNIAYHDQSATKADVVKAAKAAHAHDFIKELPKKYETIVGERGVKLSGGQKQRVVIARAVLKKTPIIVFDEATSALDSESEHIIQRALPEIIGNHTALILAHRLSTVARLDRIIVIDNGKIVEQGSHEQLLKTKGRYHSLWKRQTSEEIDL